MPRKINAYIAYRTFYAAAFEEYTQSAISSFMSCLWHFERNKPFWTLMARAYNIFRDELHFPDAPLRELIDLCIGNWEIPEPEKYLNMYGWVLEDFPNNETGLFKVFPTHSSVQIIEGVTVTDVVNYVLECNYLEFNEDAPQAPAPELLNTPHGDILMVTTPFIPPGTLSENAGLSESDDECDDEIPADGEVANTEEGNNNVEESADVMEH